MDKEDFIIVWAYGFGNLKERVTAQIEAVDDLNPICSLNQLWSKRA